jgi:hypothetical protein
LEFSKIYILKNFKINFNICSSGFLYSNMYENTTWFKTKHAEWERAMTGEDK